MTRHTDVSDLRLRAAIRQKVYTLGGNINLKIYGKLNCASGKRMKKANRIFFTTEQEAIGQGYRPCGNCMKSEYTIWKHNVRK